MNWCANIRDTRAFLRDGFGTDNLAMAANVRERLSVGKREAQKFDTEEFDLKEVNDGEHVRLKCETCLQFWRS